MAGDVIAGAELSIDATDINVGPDLTRAAPFQWRGDSGVACLLVHGLTSTPFEVRELGEHLHAAGHTVVAPLLPGHGSRLRELARTSWEEWATTVDTQYQRLAEQHDSVIVGGSSMGAALALWCASRHPVAGIIGLGTPYKLPLITHVMRVVRYVRPILPKKGGSSIANPVAKRDHPSYVGTPARSIVEMIHLLEAMRSRLHTIAAPLLMIHAWNDPVIARTNPQQVYTNVQSTHKKLIWVHRSAHIVTEDYDKELVFEVCKIFANNIQSNTMTYNQRRTF